MSKDERVPRSTSVYLSQHHQDALKRLNKKTEVPTTARIRQGVELILKAHAELIDYQSEPETD